jgi:hypothetical protein
LSTMPAIPHSHPSAHGTLSLQRVAHKAAMYGVVIRQLACCQLIRESSFWARRWPAQLICLCTKTKVLLYRATLKSGVHDMRSSLQLHSVYDKRSRATWSRRSTSCCSAANTGGRNCRTIRSVSSSRRYSTIPTLGCVVTISPTGSKITLQPLHHSQTNM